MTGDPVAGTLPRPVWPPAGAHLPAIANSIILGEDETLMRGLIRSVLQQADQTVFPAANGEEVLTLAQQFRARLVLLDIAMPRINGLLALRKIRLLPGYANVPVVVLTGYTDPRIRVAAEYLGVSDFITKPFRPDGLLLRLARYLDIPPRTLAELPPDADRSDAIPRRAQIWPRTLGQRADTQDQPLLVAGREAIRIVRKAEGGP